MFEIMLFWGLFVGFMLYRAFVIYRNIGWPMPKAEAKPHLDEPGRDEDKRNEDRDVVNDPIMFWHPLNTRNRHH